MNIRHIKFTGLTYVSLSLYSTGVGLGMYGRNRINFSSDFTYNKYHFAIFCQMLSGAGLMLTTKMNPVKAGPFQPLCALLFASTVVNLCLPSYYEGILDIRDVSFEGNT